MFWLFILYILFCLFSRLILLRQVDFKCLVAYSSVLHINFCFIRLLRISFSSIFGGLFIRVSHAFTSPLIFLWVYLSYNMLRTRNIIQFSSINYMKLRQVIITIIYIFNLRFPLLGRFISELLIFTFRFNLRNILFTMLILLTFRVPIIFTFQIIALTSKFSNFNSIYFSKGFVNIYSVRFTVTSLTICYLITFI